MLSGEQEEGNVTKRKTATVNVLGFDLNVGLSV